MEYAGAVEVDPPFRTDESEWLVDADWTVSRDGRSIRPCGHAELDECVEGLRQLIDVDKGTRAYVGAVAAYDPGTRELVVVSTRSGRVTRRMLRKARSALNRDNVIDFAGHRRTISRSAL
jgi:hypothetical protein